MSIGVTGPWVGGKGLSVGTPVVRYKKELSLNSARQFNKQVFFFVFFFISSHHRALGCLGYRHEKV